MSEDATAHAELRRRIDLTTMADNARHRLEAGRHDRTGPDAPGDALRRNTGTAADLRTGAGAVTVPDDSLRVWRTVFDIAVHSMDFGSGFLDDEEVATLREAAVLLGVDPDVATPLTFACKYRGHHRARVVTETPFFDGPDGVRRNAFLLPGSFPEDVQAKLRRTGGVAMLRAPVIRMFCGDCHQFWDALDKPPSLSVPVKAAS